ncbi:MAG: mechanosensitive ion channel family protein [Acidobacteria bacterium]|nr:MAG: mechanosensitive ion channel family protein [Acidobacteriota bacterium]REJ98859.1 MAG: mechanosensitive ion channel family protein [Acidobacteriota bacterium]REK16421.1 MAG: mechanosensitive ion channel family protein [Acidobacteriota bacterium]REK44102.1 MAG: mechanosensitive ion channel family protein [Acidobacteriota bacterium]
MYLQESAINDTITATEKAREAISEMIASFWTQAPYIVIGVIVFGAFVIAASVVKRVIKATVTRAKYDDMLGSLIGRLAYYATLIIGFFVSAVVVFPGMEPGDLLTGLGIGSVALGFAFKDVLQNLFAGFLILLYRPFRIGDLIEVDDYKGIVEEISVRATKLKTLDNERVVVPNSELYMNSVVVFTAFDDRRTRVAIGVGYGEDPDHARTVIQKTLDKMDGLLKDPAPNVRFTDFGDSSVNLEMLFWTASDQSSTRSAVDIVIAAVKKALDSEGIEIPFPQRVVEMKKSEAAAG